MRKTTPYIILFIAGIIILGFIFRNQLGSFISAESDFSISDTAAVNRIEIISEDTLVLSRSGSSWLVNGNLQANNIAINNFLFSFSRMRVKGISNNPDITDLKGLRIRISEGRKKHLLRFYVLDGISYIHREGGKKIYAVEVNGFPDIKPYQIITSDPDHWKDRTLLDLRAEEIREVKVLHPASPENDFTIRISAGKPVLFDRNGIQVPDSTIDMEKLDFYLSYFTNVFYDSTLDFESGVSPRWIIMVEDSKDRNFELQVFPLISGGKVDMFKTLVKYNNQQGYKLVRFMVLDLLLQDKGHFLLTCFTEGRE
jgi:hypothetical protein